MLNLTRILLLSFFLGIGIIGTSHAQQIGFTQEDRERQIRMETTLHMFMVQTDKRFDQTDKRFDQVDKRFDQMLNFVWSLASIFTAMTLGTIGFAFWDRRLYIRQAKEEAVQLIEKHSRLTHLIDALREIAPKYPELAASLRKFGLM